MSDLADYGITKETLQQMYAEWQSGVPKTHIELKYLGKTQSHGKLFSSLVRRYLNHDTERTHPLAAEVGRLREENQRLRQLILRYGLNPDADPNGAPPGA